MKYYRGTTAITLIALLTAQMASASILIKASVIYPDSEVKNFEYLATDKSQPQLVTTNTKPKCFVSGMHVLNQDDFDAANLICIDLTQKGTPATEIIVPCGDHPATFKMHSGKAKKKDINKITVVSLSCSKQP